MKNVIKLFTFGLLFSALLPPPVIEAAASNSRVEKLEAPTGQIILRHAGSTQPITLREAVALALVKNPELQVFDREIRAREAFIIQAGLLPNPELEATNENFGGQRAFSGFQQSQTTIALSQVILLGGKRAKRVRVASYAKDLARWDYETKRMDVLTQVSQAFTDILGAQQQWQLTQDLVRLTERVDRTVSEKVKTGKVSPIEKTRAQVALSFTRIEQQRAERELQAARNKLASTWGTTIPRFKEAQGDLASISPVPSLESLRQRVSRNPDLARWAAEIAKRHAVADNEKAKAIPDVTLTGGYQHMGQTSDNSFIVGFTLPIMIFNRNQGSIQEAKSRVSQAENKQRAAKVRVTTALAQAYQTLAFAHSQAVILRDEILPGAQSAYDAINEGYRFGKFSFLNVLDSQRTFFQAKVQYIRALTGYHKAIADVERLIGGPLNAASSTREKRQ